MSRDVQHLAAGASGATGLIGRDEELARIDAVLEAARSGTGATLLIEAAAGIGKTSLIALACERAVSAGMTVLDARASVLERDYAMGVVRQCFERELHRQGDVDALLSGAAELARHVVLDVPDRFDAVPGGVLHGLYWLTANLTERAPVLLAIDDAHWADEESLRFVAYMARRVETLPVALVVGSRPPEDPTAAAVLDELRREPASSVVEPAPLDVAGVEAFLRAAQTGPVEPAFAVACHHASGGNPFLLGELVRALRADRVAFTALHADRVTEVTPPTVARSVRATLDRLGSSQRALAQAVAVLGDGVDVSLAAALAGVPTMEATFAAGELTRVALLADATPLRFRHPLLAWRRAPRRSSSLRCSSACTGLTAPTTTARCSMALSPLRAAADRPPSCRSRTAIAPGTCGAAGASARPRPMRGSLSRRPARRAGQAAARARSSRSSACSSTKGASTRPTRSSPPPIPTHNRSSTRRRRISCCSSACRYATRRAATPKRSRTGRSSSGARRASGERSGSPGSPGCVRRWRRRPRLGIATAPLPSPIAPSRMPRPGTCPDTSVRRCTPEPASRTVTPASPCCRKPRPATTLAGATGARARPVDAGAFLRRRGDRVASRQPLRDSYRLAENCRANALAEAARAELRASGIRVQRQILDGVDGLTASERRIADMVADGASNADIAQALFLGVKTVEMHLTRVYRKLDISRRADLPRALAQR